VSRLERLDLLADGLERDGGSRGRLLDRREGELHREAKRERLEEMGVARSRERNVLLATCRVRGFPRFMTLNRQEERGGRGHCHKKLQNRTEAIQEGSNGNTAERDGYRVYYAEAGVASGRTLLMSVPKVTAGEVLPSTQTIMEDTTSA
jgi:hypothetical protein